MRVDIHLSTLPTTSTTIQLSKYEKNKYLIN